MNTHYPWIFLHAFWRIIFIRIYPLISDRAKTVESGAQSIHPLQENRPDQGSKQRLEKKKKFPRSSWWPFPESYGNEKRSFVKHSELHKHINWFFFFYFFHLAPTHQTLPSRLPLRFSVSREGATLYHSNIFFKEVKRRNCLKATCCLLSPSTI